ncbi:MAG: hypothetical protein V7K88_26580 [Nostoc sp.]|uniref:hypothetical protein n=1 Tax=Nostoc sp. TaxID=1180 RepID=UPI002FFA639E
MYPGSEQIEVLGEKLLPEFYQVFVLFYLAVHKSKSIRTYQLMHLSSADKCYESAT